MRHTEAQANELWCPMARVVMPPAQTANRVATALLSISGDKDRAYFESQQQNCNCIASKCAMWQWNAKEQRQMKPCANQNTTYEENAGPKPDGCEGWEFKRISQKAVAWVETEELCEARRTGYCGLAGVRS